MHKPNYETERRHSETTKDLKICNSENLFINMQGNYYKYLLITFYRIRTKKFGILLAMQ